MSARTWEAANQAWLVAAVDEARRALERHAALAGGAGGVDRDGDEEGDGDGDATAATPRRSRGRRSGGRSASADGDGEGADDGDAARPMEWRFERPPALEAVVETFGLSRFERAVLVACAGIELSGDFAALCGRASGDAARGAMTFSLALAALPEPHWTALNPEAPLRHWKLIELGPGAALTQSPLRIDERVLHFLVGVSHRDARLAGVAEAAPPPRELAPSHLELAKRIAGTWSHAAAEGDELPAVQLTGPEAATRRDVAAAACRLLGLRLDVAPSPALPTAAAELETLAGIWERESALDPAALLVDRGDHDGEPQREDAIDRLVERIRGPVLVSTHDARRTVHRPVLTFEVGRPGPAERREVWTEALGDDAHRLHGRLDALVHQFNLGPPAIRAACAGALGRLEAEAEPGSRAKRLDEALWDTCRVQARTAVGDLAQRIDASVGWDDLVLPAPQRQVLRDLAAQVRNRARVHEEWGFAARGSRGLGITALFAGDSGTGKTLAAEVIATELRLDLYRIDLAGLISKYIGETEKNLRRVFDAAEEGGCILLFDEADAVFGRRTEVKDSHDRHANVEVSYLLQRMEAYPGLALLTTNFRDALDTAFLRRIRFIVHFPFPDAEQRAEIWRRVFPSGTPIEGLKHEELAKLNVSGGNIRNIALNAAFYAAEGGEPVRMSHLLRAARAEYDKLERPLTAAEVGGWV